MKLLSLIYVVLFRAFAGSDAVGGGGGQLAETNPILRFGTDAPNSCASSGKVVRRLEH